MAKYGVTNIAGGGGIGSDEVSVTKEYVLNGKTYVGSDTNDEIGTGAMVNNGATGNQSLNAGGSFSVKKGYHAQDFTVNANSLASQTPGNASAGSILSGESAYVNGNKVTGSMPNYGSTPTAIDAIRINNNRFEVAVTKGFHGYSWANGGYEYMSYDQVANAIGLTPNKLKKGEWVCGRTGTFEGYVPTVTDLYLRGNNPAGFRVSPSPATAYTKLTLEAGQMRINHLTSSSSVYDGILSGIAYNISGYSFINMEFYTQGGDTGSSVSLHVLRDVPSDGVYPLSLSDGYTSTLPGVGTTNTLSLNISGINGNRYFFINVGRNKDIFVYRVWLS